jgi:hypothetical protein
MRRVLDHPRTPRGVLIAAGVLLVAGLVGLASVPTGAETVQGTVPEGRRVAASARVADVRVMVLSSGSRLNVLVAYHGEKGWHGVAVDPAPAGAVAAWAATRGGGDVPALSAVYGRATGAKVTVRWVDGRTASTTPASDGTYLVARTGMVRAARVTVLGVDGAVLTAVDGP